jgi:hypothetical protein
VTDVLSWTGCANEPSAILRWLECHPSSATVITGAIALLSATIGLYAVYLQTNSQKKLEEAQRRRKLLANRATLCLAMDAVAEYTKRCAEIIGEIYKRGFGGGGQYTDDLPALPHLSSSTVDQLKELAELGTDEIQGAVTAMLNELQLLTARLNSVLADYHLGSFRPSTSTLADELVLNASAVSAWSSAFFEFAREKRDTLPTQMDEATMHNEMNVLGFRSPKYERLHALLSVRFKRD